MTVSTTNSVYSYDGDGVTVAFSFPRYAQSSAQITAVVVDETTGEETSPTYTVSGAASSWTVTFATAPASTKKVVLYRDPSVVQETDFSSEGDPRAAMTAKADLLTMEIQALRNRALRMGNGTLQDFSPVVPNPTGAAGYSLTINDDEDGIELRTELTAGATVSAAMSPVINGSIANARALLGVTDASASTIAVTAINIGHASDTTLSRNAAGVLQVESDPIVMRGNAETISGAKMFSAAVIGSAQANRFGSAAGSSSSPTNANTNLLLYNNSTTSYAGLGADTNGHIYFVTGTSSPSTRMMITSSGQVNYRYTAGVSSISVFMGQGDAIHKWGPSINATSVFYVTNQYDTGVYLVDGNNVWTSSSDIRLKNVRGDLTGALDRICALEPIRYTWKAEDYWRDYLVANGETPKQQKVFTGFSAQNVLEHIPEAVHVPAGYDAQQTFDPQQTFAENARLGVSPTDLIPEIVQAMKEMRAENDALRARVEALEAAAA